MALSTGLNLDLRAPLGLSSMHLQEVHTSYSCLKIEAT